METRMIDAFDGGTPAPLPKTVAIRREAGIAQPSPTGSGDGTYTISTLGSSNER